MVKDILKRGLEERNRIEREFRLLAIVLTLLKNPHSYTNVYCFSFSTRCNKRDIESKHLQTLYFSLVIHVDVTSNHLSFSRI